MTEDPSPKNEHPNPAFGPATKPVLEARDAEHPLTTETDAASATRLRVAERIGNYHIKRTIGCGGMGTVYEAIQEHPRRPVALKVMNPDAVSRSALRRFEHESQLLARLRHPGIAQVYEAGTYEGPTGPIPFFAMEYIPNARSITKYAHEKSLSTRQRLDMFVAVCEAADHGHQKGIIHRDIKPGNILVDPQGQVKLIDFGVARATDADLTVTTLQTGVGQLIGTLKYMSPEQCEADPLAIDRRSDVYALGVVLYELLTGKMPYDLEATPIFDAPRVIREVPPTPLSRVNKTLRGDVETVVAKALEKDPDRRYPSAHVLAEDIRRFLRNEPILARPASAVYRLRKLLRRRRVPVSVAALLLAALGLAAYNRIQVGAAVAARGKAEALIGELLRSFESLNKMFYESDPDLAADQRALVNLAITDWSRVIELVPHLAKPYGLRSKVFQLNGDHKRAWEDCTRALEIDPTDSQGLRTKAFLLLERGDFEAAFEVYNLGIRGAEGLPDDFHNRARLYRIFGRNAEALDDHDRAVAGAPDVGIVYVGRGTTRRFTGNFDGAVADFVQAGKLPGDWFLQSSQWIWEMRMLRRNPGDLEAAEAILAEAERRATTPFKKAMIGISGGSVSVEQGLAAAMGDKKLRCVAQYYAGARALVEDRRDDAAELFRQCRQSGMHMLPEYDLARWHLERSGRGVP